MTALPAPIAAKVAKILGRFGSNADGEIIAASRALVRTLDGAGLGLADLVAHVEAPPPPPQILWRDQSAKEPDGPKSYGDWRGTWRQGWERSSPNSELARVRRCQRLAEDRLSAWEGAFLGSLSLRLNQGLCLTSKQLSVLVEIEKKLGLPSC